MRPWRMLASSGYVRLSQAAICCGDQRASSLASTTWRNAGCSAKRAGFGRWARCQAATSAVPARYCARPPLRATSREMLLGARPSRAAMARHESLAASPREISSRSAAVSAPSARVGGGRRHPPEAMRKRRTACRYVPKYRLIARSDSPRRHRVQISSCSAADHRPAAAVCMGHLTASPRFYPGGAPTP